MTTLQGSYECGYMGPGHERTATDIRRHRCIARTPWAGHPHSFDVLCAGNRYVADLHTAGGFRTSCLYGVKHEER